MKNVWMFVLAVGLLAAACGTTDADNSAERSDALSEQSATATEESVPADSEPEAAAETQTVAPVEPGDDAADETPTTTESPLKPATTKPAEPDEPVPADPGDELVTPPAIEHPNSQVVIAMTDLAGRLGVAADSIDVVSVEEVTWPDGSVGCPQPGMRYTQALVNGSRIVLRVDGVDYQYNSGGGREPFYCAEPGDPVPGGGDYGDI
jgi:hypothetical protein